MQSEPRSVVSVLINDFGGRPGEIFLREAVLRRLGSNARLRESAVDEAENMGWVRALSRDYVELTRRGYLEARLDPSQ